MPDLLLLPSSTATGMLVAVSLFAAHGRSLQVFLLAVFLGLLTNFSVADEGRLTTDSSELDVSPITASLTFPNKTRRTPRSKLPVRPTNRSSSFYKHKRRILLSPMMVMTKVDDDDVEK